MTELNTDDVLVYVGTYTRIEPHVQGKADGIYLYRLNRETGALEYLATTTGVLNPSFVTVDAAQRRLYAVQEIEEFEGQPGGGASAFSIDPRTGELTLINHQPTHGNHPCFVSVDSTRRWLMTANYGGGSVTVLPIGEDGALGAATAVVQHDGPHPFHDGPHPHSIRSTPDGKYVLVPDCGLDRVYTYQLDTAAGTLNPNDPPWATAAPGAGPRHLAFHPGGSYVYCINERNSSLTAFAYDAEAGVLREIQTLSTLPAGYTERNSCADIHIDPSGRYVYGSNRGHDSIAIFAIDQASGQMSLVGHVSTEGRTPRNFGIDPSGTFLLAANQDTSNVVAFRIDPATGGLTPTGEVTDIPSPVCLEFVMRSDL